MSIDMAKTDLGGDFLWDRSHANAIKELWSARPMSGSPYNDGNGEGDSQDQMEAHPRSPASPSLVRHNTDDDYLDTIEVSDLHPHGYKL
eukprot:m.238257 g.238257  ORF g.238257 m.238257 type:complete len:89 (-) comp16059_c0_seq8:371-637(-)